jgi:hypothetical protein
MSTIFRVMLMPLTVACAERTKPDVGDSASLPIDTEVIDTAQIDSGGHVDDHAHDVSVEWESLAPTPAGDFSAVSISPFDPNRIYLGSDKSGLFWSSSAVPSFTRIGAFAGPSPHVLQPVVELPDAPDVIIVNCLHDLWLSPDGGVTFSLIGAFAEMDSGVMGVAALPGLIVVAEANGNIWSTTDQFVSVEFMGLALVGDDRKDWVTDEPAVTIGLVDEDIWLLSVRGAGVLRTYNRGIDWSPVVDQAVDHDSLVVHEGQAMVATESGILRSVDSGINWTHISGSPEACRSMSWSSPTVAAVCSDRFFVSDDDGETWEERVVSDTPMSVAVAPTDPQRLVVGGVSSAMWSDDRGATMNEVRDGLLNIDEAYFASHPEDPDVVMMGTQCLRGFFRSTDQGRSWLHVQSEGHYVMGLQYAPSDSEVFYGCDADVVFRSADAGQTISTLTDLPDGVTHPHGMSVHPEDADTLLVGTSDRTASDGFLHTPRLVRTVDAGQTWEVIGDGLPTGEMAFMVVAYDPFDPARVIVGAGPGGVFHETESGVTEGAGLWVSTDGGENFTQTESELSDLHILNAAFDPHVENRLIVATNEGLYLSTDGMNTWRSVLPSEMLGGVVWHPVYTDTAFASHGLSAWVSVDGAETWANMADHGSHALPLPDGGGATTSGLALSSDGNFLYLGAGATGGLRGALTWGFDHPGE